MGFTKVTLRGTSRTQISQLPDKSWSHSSQSGPGGLSDRVGVSKAPYPEVGLAQDKERQLGWGECASVPPGPVPLYMLSKRARSFKQGSDLPVGPPWVAGGSVPISP